jgi:OOP family OmpA-OmpF porin
MHCVTLLLLGLLACTAPALGEGVYLGGAFGARTYDNACEAHALACASRDSAWGAFAGYRFNRRWSFEAGYLDLGDAQATYPRVTSALAVTGHVDGYDLAALFAIPTGNRGQFLLRAGGYRWQAATRSVEFSADDVGWSATAGAAFEWRLGQHWQLRCQYLYLDDLGSGATGRANGHLASVALSYGIRAQR